MGCRREWQRGTFDIVSVIVGGTVLLIAVLGTAFSLTYGRGALIHEEHYKAGAYLLRGEMEKWQALIQADPDRYQTQQSLTNRYTTTINLTSVGDRDGEAQPVEVTIVRDPVEPVDLMETGEGIDYFILTASATWRENDFGINPRATSSSTKLYRLLEYRTAIPIKD